jgi:RHS repeat-associated protein
VATKFVYDGVDVLRDLDGNGNTIADYLGGPGVDNKLRQTSGGAASYFLTDHLGSTRALTDPSGNITENLSHDSFGNLTSGSASTRYTYTNREFDADTGLMYYRARWYDPREGRFLSEDPIGFLGGPNLYGYVSNDPINLADPLGLQGRADARWGKDEVESARRLADKVRSMPSPKSDCSCMPPPQNPVVVLGAIAVMDGPQPGPADVIAIVAIIAAIASSPPAACTPDNVIPFPKPHPRPTPLFPPMSEAPTIRRRRDTFPRTSETS